MLAEERNVPGDLLVNLEVEERAPLDVKGHRLRPVGRQVVVGVAVGEKRSSARNFRDRRTTTLDKLTWSTRCPT